MGLTKDEILSAADAPLSTVDIPQWGGAVYLRVMTGAERESWEDIAFNDTTGSKGLIRASLLVRCICDNTGKRIFADSDAEALSTKSATVLIRLYNAARGLNMVAVDSVEDAKKNS